MDSRRNTDVGGACLPEISRRTLIAGSPAAAVAWRAPPPATGSPDDGTRRLKHWLALNGKIERLQDRWARLENWLVQEHDWFELSSAEQQSLPWGRELRDIDGCIDVLMEKRDGLLPALPASRSVSVDSIFARLAVVERLIWPDDHPEAHALVAGVREDLIALFGTRL